MAFGINSGGNLSKNPNFYPINKSNHIFCSNPILSLSNQTKKTNISLSQTQWNSPLVVPPPPPPPPPPSDKDLKPDSNTKRDVNFSAKIESWMQNSVPDIVKNLKQAPLLVQIYSEDGRMRVEMEKALLQDWSFVRNQWGNGKSKSPDGLIFVEELKENDDDEVVDQESSEEGGLAKAWGVIVQGKGVECGPCCYLLKTNKVCGGMGLGFCTHFCLMRVNNFRDSAFQQFKDSWLLQ